MGWGQRVWVASLGEEVLYEADLPACCQRSVSSGGGGGSEEGFECPACGAIWRAAVPAEPEECAFTERASDGARKGAA